LNLLAPLRIDLCMHMPPPLMFLSDRKIYTLFLKIMKTWKQLKLHIRKPISIHIFFDFLRNVQFPYIYIYIYIFFTLIDRYLSTPNSSIIDHVLSMNISSLLIYFLMIYKYIQGGFTLLSRNWV